MCPLLWCRLCKIKYFNNCLFYNVQRNFIAQTGDPTNTGKGGESIWGVLYGEQVGSSWLHPAGHALWGSLQCLEAGAPGGQGTDRQLASWLAG